MHIRDHVGGRALFLQEDIRQLDFRELRRAGYRGAVFDKDNCLVCSLKRVLSVTR